MNLGTIQNAFYTVLTTLLIAEKSTTRPLLVACSSVPAIEMQSQVGEVHSRWHSAAKPEKVLARGACDATPLGLCHETHTAANEANTDQRRCTPLLPELHSQNVMNNTSRV